MVSLVHTKIQVRATENLFIHTYDVLNIERLQVAGVLDSCTEFTPLQKRAHRESEREREREACARSFSNARKDTHDQI